MAYHENLLLLDGVTTTGPGPWRAFGAVEAAQAVVTGIVSGDEVDIEVANVGINEEPTASDIVPHVATITADGTFDIPAGPTIIRGNLTAAAGGGTVKVRLQGVTRVTFG